MAIVNLKSTKLTALAAKPISTPTFRRGYGAPLRVFVDKYVSATGDSIDSTFDLISLPSNAVLVWGSLRSDGTLDQPNTDVGLVHVDEQGTETEYDAVIATAVDNDDTGDHVFYGALYDITRIDANAELTELWELAGLTEDPGGTFQIRLKLDAATVAGGIGEVEIHAITD